MNNPFASAKLIKKYQTLPNILKAMGLTSSSFREQASSKHWTTISLAGKIDDYEVNVSFHVKINKENKLEFNYPRLIVTKLPLKEYQKSILESCEQLHNERIGIYK